MRKYIRIMRIDHWIKNAFIVPGIIIAVILAPPAALGPVVSRFFLGLAATCLTASANYVINEWLDAAFDKFHPTKKYRSVVSENVKGGVVAAMYAALAAGGLVLAWFVDLPFFFVELWLLVMGVLYNVKPFRTKDIPVVDVLSESVNNAIRLLLGWFMVTELYLPPVSILLGYWFGGAYLMAIKRYAEYRMIGDPELAGKYRRSFRYYTEKSLLVSSFFYAMASTFFVGIFLVKYRIELILFVPFLMGLFCLYLYISFKDDSSVQKPEKLYKERSLMLYMAFLAVVFALCMFIRIPGLEQLMSDILVRF